MIGRLLVVILLLLTLSSFLYTGPQKAAQTPYSFGETADDIPNYDVRTAESKAASAARVQLRLKQTPQQAARNVATVFSMRDAQAALQASVPTLQVLLSLATGTPEMVCTNLRGQTFLTAPSTHKRGMGEGWSDFYARALLSSVDENVNGVYPAGPYATLNIATNFSNNYYYGIRRFPYVVKTNRGVNGKPHNPLTFAEADPRQISLIDGAFARGPIGSATTNEVHNLGKSGVWPCLKCGHG